MRMRTLLATATASALIAGVAGVSAYADPVPSPTAAGTVSAWGAASVSAATTVPSLTAPVVAVAASPKATAVVTDDGGLQVWGSGTASEVTWAPDDVTDAVDVSLAQDAGAVLHADGTVTGWGGPGMDAVPDGLRAKAISVASGTGYAVRTDGTLAKWGADGYAGALPDGLTDLVDVSANLYQVIVLKADGTIITWSQYNPDLAAVPDFEGKKITQITAGGGSSGVILDDGTIKVWGPTSDVRDNVPDFDGESPAETVTSLNLDTNAGAITADGVLHVWGSTAEVKAVPDSLDPPTVVTGIDMGDKHAAAISTTFRELSKPVVTGTPQVGETLSVGTPATLTAAPDTPATGQWYAGADPIAGQTGTTLTLDQTMLGKNISYRSTATRAGETVVSTSNEVGPVALVASTTMLTVTPATGKYGTGRTATATVTKIGGTPTGTVKFTVGSTEGTASLTGGKATWALPETLKVGKQTVTASYQGDATTAASTSAANVTVTKVASKVKATKPKVKGKTKKIAKKVKLTLTVKAAKGVSPVGKVKVTLKGKTTKKVTAKVNAKGKAKVTIKKVKRGKYKAQLNYRGNATVAPAKKTVKFKV